MNNQPSTNATDNADSNQEVKIDVSNGQNVPINIPTPAQPEPVFQPENPPTTPQAPPPPPAQPIPTPPVETLPTPPASTPPQPLPPNQPPVKNVPQEPTIEPETTSQAPTAQTPPTAQPQPDHIEAEEYGLQPPIKQPKPHSSVALITTIAILFLGLGFGSGFFGYKYVPKFQNMFGASADTDKATTPTTIDSTTIDTNIDTATWKPYTNTKYKYSINYPGNWLSDSLTDKEIKTIQFTSYKQDTGSTSADGYKVEITFQDSNGKTLKDWVSANNTISGTSGAPSKTTVNSKEAYQQELNGVSKSISTYVLQNNLVMIISYYASDAKFSTGKPYYDQMIESIKFS